jgi:hypothetical protein
MNVKVCSFPDDDPIVLLKTSYDDLVAYLDEENKKILYSSKLLFNEGSKNDPIKSRFD